MEVINDFIGDLFGYDLQCNILWKTDIVKYDTGVEQRNQIWSVPKRSWVLPYNNLTLTQRNNLVELFNRMRGGCSEFLFEDPFDYECALTECSITAVAAQTNFQLLKKYYPNESDYFSENKKDIQPSTVHQPIIKVDGATKTETNHYNLDDATGIVVFGSAPGAGKVITANYYYYYRVRFDIDSYGDTFPISSLFNVGGVPITQVVRQ